MDPSSAQILSRIGLDSGLHPDFGTVWNGAPNGIPYVVVSADQPRVPITFTDYGDESDPGPYPVPPDAPIGGGAASDGDRHVLVVDRDGWQLYELFNARPDGSGGWLASSGAVFDLSTDAQRPAGWTSADAAGLPIFPGLVRYDEAVELGRISHALRFTVQRTRRVYLPPARHWASRSTDPMLPPMGMRVRLRGRLRCLQLSVCGAGDPLRAEDVRHVRRRQRQATGSSAERPTHAGATTTCRPSAACAGATSRSSRCKDWWPSNGVCRNV